MTTQLIFSLPLVVAVLLAERFRRIVQPGVADSASLFHLVAAVVVSSILIHSTLDVPVARWAADGREEHGPRPLAAAASSGGAGEGVARS